MRTCSVVLLAAALTAAVVGFTDVVPRAAWVGQSLCFLFAAVFSVCTLKEMLDGPPGPRLRKN